MHDGDKGKRPRLTRWLTETLDGLLGRQPAAKPSSRQGMAPAPAPRRPATPTTSTEPPLRATAPAAGREQAPATGFAVKDPAPQATPATERPTASDRSGERPTSPDVRSLRWKDPPGAKAAKPATAPRPAATATPATATPAAATPATATPAAATLATATPSAAAPEATDQELKRVKRELADAQLMLMGKEAAFRNELKELQERNSELLNKIVRLTQRDRELQARIVDAQFNGSGAKAEVKKLDEELRDLRRAYQRKERELETLTSRVEELQRSGAEAEERLGECGEGLEEEREALDAVHARIRENLATVADLTTERDRLRNRLVGAEGEMAALKQHLQSALTRRAQSGSAPRPEAAGRLPTPATQAGGRGVSPEPGAAPKLSAEPVPSAEAAPSQEPAPSPKPASLNQAAPPTDVLVPEAVAEFSGMPRPFFVSGTEDCPLFAMAAGQRPEVAEAAQARRAKRTELAVATLRAFRGLGGIPRVGGLETPHSSQDSTSPKTVKRGERPSGEGPSGRGRRGRPDGNPRGRQEPPENRGGPAGKQEPRRGGPHGRRSRSRSRD